MTDIVISQKESETTAPKKNMEEEVTDALKGALEIERIEKENQRLQKALMEREELRAKMALGGKSIAGQPMETEDQRKMREVKEEAERLVKAFR